MAQSQQTVRTLKCLDLELYDPEASAHVRDDLPDQIVSVQKSNFSVAFELLYEVHGGYDVGNQDNASLLVLRAVPKPKDLKKQFVWFKVALIGLPDEDGQPGSFPEDQLPVLKSFEPASQGDQFADVYTTNETRESMLKVSLQASSYGGGEGSRSSKSEFKRHHLFRVKSGKEQTLSQMPRKSVNKVWWEIRAANKEDGIGDSFTVALLVCRPKESKFRVHAEVDGEIGVFERLKNSFVPSGLRSKRPPTLLDTFGPANTLPPAQKLPKDVDANNLHAASTGNVMKRIEEVGLHLSEQARLPRFEEGMVGSRLELEREKPILDQNVTVGVAKDDRMDMHERVAAVSSIQATTYEPDAMVQPDWTPSCPTLAGRPRAETPSSVKTTTLHAPPADVRPSQEKDGGQPRNQAAPAMPIYSAGRVERLRKMAAHYERLAELHREEARECMAQEELAYVDEVERQAL